MGAAFRTQISPKSCLSHDKAQQNAEVTDEGPEGKWSKN